MMSTRTGAQTLARPVISGLIVLNILYAIGVAALLVSSFLHPGWPWVPMGFDLAKGHPALPVALRTITVIGLFGAALVHLVLTNLRSVVDTVRQGDPFIAENARRLRAIAWYVMAGEALRLIVVAIAAALSTDAQPVDMGDGFSFAPWLAVLLLFVLAGVFTEGSRMRADLDGTV